MRYASLVGGLLLTVQAPSVFSFEPVPIEDREWLQPAWFVGISPRLVAEACPPPSGRCTGILARRWDMAGYFWASMPDIELLLNQVVRPDPPFTLDELLRPPGPIPDDHRFLDTSPIFEYFEPTSTWYEDAPQRAMHIVTRSPAQRPEHFQGISTAYVLTWDEVHLDDTYAAPWFWRPARDGIIIGLGEPVADKVNTGIGMIRGWAVATEGIDRIELFIDGRHMYDLAYGDKRVDIGNQYPDMPDADYSGFSRPFNYSNLGFGEHTIAVRAYDRSGSYREASNTFTVTSFDEPFVDGQSTIDTSAASSGFEGQRIYVQDIHLGDRLYDLVLEWRNEEQGFEIVEIR